MGEKTKYLCSRTNVELAFLRAVRKQGSSLKAGMGREEFMDFVIRASEQVRMNLKRSKHDITPAECLEVFVNEYFLGPYLESEIGHDRKLIRRSRRLNALLSDNMFAFRKLFSKYAHSHKGKAG